MSVLDITGQISVTLGIDEALAEGLESGDLGLSESVILPFLGGTAAGQCDLKWSRSSTLAAGASDTWTLSALTDGLGRAIAFARIKLLLIETDATVDGDDLTIGGAASHPWTAIGTGLVVKSLGVLALAATNATGFVVAAGSADQLKITNSGANPITYRIVLAGCSA